MSREDMHRNLSKRSPEGASSADQQGVGGVTLFDLLLAIAGSWALPWVGRALDLERTWVLLLGVLNAPAGMLWAFYCRRIGWYLFVRGREDRKAGDTSVAAGKFLAEFLSILMLTIALQYIAYRGVLAIVRPWI